MLTVFHGRRAGSGWWITAAIASAVSAVIPAPASANGCTVLLCLAGNWSQIQQCVPPVRQALRDVARGRGWPSCSMSSSSSSGGSSAYNRQPTAAECPGSYLSAIRDHDSGQITGYSCNLAGVVEVKVEGAVWSKTFWDWNENAITWYSPAAKSALNGVFDPTYDALEAQWVGTPQHSEWNCYVHGICPIVLPENTGNGA